MTFIADMAGMMGNRTNAVQISLSGRRSATSYTQNECRNDKQDSPIRSNPQAQWHGNSYCVLEAGDQSDHERVSRTGLNSGLIAD